MSSRFILPFADVGSGIKPSDGAQLFFFDTGTSTPRNTFSDQGSPPTPNANPVIANSKGVFGDIFIEGAYKVVLKDKNDVQIWEADPVVSLVQQSTIIEDNIGSATAAGASGAVGGFVRTNEYTSGSESGGSLYRLVNVDPGFLLINPRRDDGLWLEFQRAGTEFDIASAGLTSSDSTAEIQQSADYAASKGVDLTGSGETIISSRITMTNINADLKRLKITLADSFPDSEGILFTGTNQGEIRYLTAFIDGNRANQSGAIAAVSVLDVQNPLSNYNIYGFECGTVAKFHGATEKFVAIVGAKDCDLACHLTDTTTGGDETPDEANITVTGSNCVRYLDYDGGGSGKVALYCEGQDGTSPAISITGTKAIALDGEMRAMNNPILVNATTCALTLNGLNFIDTTGTFVIESIKTLLGSIYFEGSGIDRIDIQEVTTGGSFEVVSSGTAATFGVKLGDIAAARVCQKLRLVTNTTGAFLFENCAGANVVCTQAPASIDFSNPATLNNFIQIPAAFITGNNPVTETVAPAQNNTIDVVGNVSTTNLTSYTTPFRGMRVQHNRTSQSRPSYFTATGVSGWQTPDMSDI